MRGDRGVAAIPAGPATPVTRLQGRRGGSRWRGPASARAGAWTSFSAGCKFPDENRDMGCYSEAVFV